jgi:hypothetical protein
LQLLEFQAAVPLYLPYLPVQKVMRGVSHLVLAQENTLLTFEHSLWQHPHLEFQGQQQMGLEQLARYLSDWDQLSQAQ